MFGYIRGILAEASPLYVIIETAGVGYKLFIPTSVHAHLPQKGSEILFHTSFVVRELSQTLYGFISGDERDLFEVLMGVSGIGPKTALAVLGHLTPENLCEAVRHNEITSICKVPGIGRKSAEKLIIELRDKLPALQFSGPDKYSLPGKNGPQLVKDAMSALINLGYNQATAEKSLKKAIEEMPEVADLAKLITLSLTKI